MVSTKLQDYIAYKYAAMYICESLLSMDLA